MSFEQVLEIPVGKISTPEALEFLGKATGLGDLDILAKLPTLGSPLNEVAFTEMPKGNDRAKAIRMDLNDAGEGFVLTIREGSLGVATCRPMEF